MEDLEQLEEERPKETVLSEETVPEQEPLPPQPPVKELRKEANTQGGVLLIYYAIMNVAVAVVMFLAALEALLPQILAGAELDPEALDAVMMDASGWGYLLAIGVGLMVLLLWKKPRYICHTIGQKGRSMTVGSFFVLLSLTMSAQLVAQLEYLGLEGLLKLLGLDPAVLDGLYGVESDTLPMFLYIGILAPISEELLFRGLLLRSIAPYGKKLAIFGSAVLFGLYHANLIQIPYAMIVGLVLGYTALEYHIWWAIGLHMFNNLVFGLLLPMALSPLPGLIVDILLWAVIIGFFVAALLIVIAKFDGIAADWKRERLQPWQRRALFRAPTVVILILLCLVSTVAAILLLS